MRLPGFTDERGLPNAAFAGAYGMMAATRAVVGEFVAAGLGANAMPRDLSVWKWNSYISDYMLV